MSIERKLSLQNDYIMQELDGIKKELFKVKNSVPSMQYVSKEVNVIINSDTEISIGNIEKDSIIIVNITNTGTTTSTGSATMILQINDIVATEQTIAYRDSTSVATLVFRTSTTGNCKILVTPANELVPIKVDRVQAYIINNI